MIFDEFLNKYTYKNTKENYIKQHHQQQNQHKNK